MLKYFFLGVGEIDMRENTDSTEWAEEIGSMFTRFGPLFKEENQTEALEEFDKTRSQIQWLESRYPHTMHFVYGKVAEIYWLNLGQIEKARAYCKIAKETVSGSNQHQELAPPDKEFFPDSSRLFKQADGDLNKITAENNSQYKP